MLKRIGGGYLHNPGVRVGEIPLSLIGWLGLRGLTCRRLFFLGFSLCGFQLFGSLFPGLLLKRIHGFFDLCQPSLTPFEFIRQIPTLPTLAVLFILLLVYHLGIFEKCFDLFFKLLFFFFILP